MTNISKEYYKYKKQEEEIHNKMQSILSKERLLREEAEILNVRLNCGCHSPNFYYDKIYEMVKCDHCDNSILRTKFYKLNNVEYSEENSLEAVEETLKNVIESDMLFYIYVKGKNDEYLGYYYISFTNTYDYGFVMNTNLHFSETSHYITLPEDSIGITINDLKYLVYKLSLEKGLKIEVIEIVQLFKNR